MLHAWKPSESVSMWLGRAGRLLTKLQEAELREFGFSMGQMPVLFALLGGDALSQRELAERAQVEQPTMAEMLARMLRDGIIERTDHPDDGRTWLYALTRKAKTRIPKAREALIEIERAAVAGLSVRERKRLVASLERVERNLTRARARP